ncbi:hypothetical protein FB451DRAFT_1495816 [Mycena latifolia]|nr:hypothetical protein FB451DRAFT_1495816 [Mycena latifolia]
MQALTIFFTHEPLLYRALVIGGDALDEIPPCPVEAFTRIAGTESVSFLRDSVHNLHHTQHRRRAQQYSPHLDRSKAPVLFGPFESFSHPLFSHLTHLELFAGLTDDDDDLATWTASSITGLSHLTHLSFDTTAILAICAHLLTGYSRFVMMLLEHYTQDWQRGILTGNDYWSSADSLIEVRSQAIACASGPHETPENSKHRAEQTRGGDLGLVHLPELFVYWLNHKIHHFHSSLTSGFLMYIFDMIACLFRHQEHSTLEHRWKLNPWIFQCHEVKDFQVQQMCGIRMNNIRTC